jgi:hypothetical protein
LKALLLILAVATMGAAGLPPGAAALQEPIRAAERRLQDASLELQVAKHAAGPLQEKVSEARQRASTWWGSWLLKRRLGQLKASLDKVEAARAAQVAARQDLALLLTGADEELTAALEVSLGGAPKPSPAMIEKWRAWWLQRRAWQQRLVALAPGEDEAASGPGTGRESVRIREEARQAQAEREAALIDSLRKHHALPRL